MKTPAVIAAIAALLALASGAAHAQGDDEDLVHLRVRVDGRVRSIAIRLDGKAAPVAAGNFRRKVREGFYNGLAFHRAIGDFLIQAGDPLSRDDGQRERWGSGSSGEIQAEIGPRHRRGSVGMARRGASGRSSASQFYIALRPLPELDGEYAVFGQVTAGLDVADEIAGLPADANDNPLRRVEIISAAIGAPATETAPPGRKGRGKRKRPADPPRGDGKERWGDFMKRLW